MLADEQPGPVQLESFRRITPEARLLLAERLYWSARSLKASWLRSIHPDWTEEQIACEVTRIFSHGRHELILLAQGTSGGDRMGASPGFLRTGPQEETEPYGGNATNNAKAMR